MYQFHLYHMGKMYNHLVMFNYNLQTVKIYYSPYILYTAGLTAAQRGTGSWIDWGVKI